MCKVKVPVDKSVVEQPKYLVTEKVCLVTWIKVNGHETWALWDSGSTMLGLTPSFAYVVQMKVALLATPIMLQLGIIGSCSMVAVETLGSPPALCHLKSIQDPHLNPAAHPCLMAQQYALLAHELKEPLYGVHYIPKHNGLACHSYNMSESTCLA